MDFSHLGPKVLVSSGYNGSPMNSTEVVDLKSGKIFSMAPLGRRPGGATGGLLDELPVICGGDNDMIHSIAKDQSKFLGQLSVKRKYAASVVLSNNTLWVTGGYDQSLNDLKSTEIVTKDGQTSQGPELPLPLSRHAIVPLNSGAFILIGGYGGDSSPQQPISMRRRRVGGQDPTSRREEVVILREC